MTTRPSYRVGASRRLFEFASAPSGGNPRFAVTLDGTLFVILQAGTGPGPPPEGASRTTRFASSTSGPVR